MSKKLTYDELQTAVLKLINDADLHREPYRSNTAKRIIWLVQDNTPELATSPNQNQQLEGDEA